MVVLELSQAELPNDMIHDEMEDEELKDLKLYKELIKKEKLQQPVLEIGSPTFLDVLLLGNSGGLSSISFF